VVTSRGLVRYVTTEYGTAYLHGKTIRQRAQALIEIAHPKFREELYEYCEKTKWLQRPLVTETAAATR
jgi:acyl-CoA hydrolase